MTVSNDSRFLVVMKFVNHKAIKYRVRAPDHFMAVSKAMEATVEKWPVARPISIASYTGDEAQAHDTKYYRVTKGWRLLEEEHPYTTFAGERHG